MEVYSLKNKNLIKIKKNKENKDNQENEENDVKNIKKQENDKLKFKITNNTKIEKQFFSICLSTKAAPDI